jgi:hypothetical protein
LELIASLFEQCGRLASEDRPRGNQHGSHDSAHQYPVEPTRFLSLNRSFMLRQPMLLATASRILFRDQAPISHHHFSLPQSSSASCLTPGAAGLLLLSQSRASIVTLLLQPLLHRFVSLLFKTDCR